MNILKRFANIGLSAQIQNLIIDNNKDAISRGQYGNVYVLGRIVYGCGFNFDKFCIETRSNLATVSTDGYFFWRSKGLKTKEEAIGYFTKEVRIAQKQFPEIYFFKFENYSENEISDFDEFIDNGWIKSKIPWCDAFDTMGEYR